MANPGDIRPFVYLRKGLYPCSVQYSSGAYVRWNARNRMWPMCQQLADV